MTSAPAETLAEKVLKQIYYRLQMSRDRTEREILKAILLSVGITSVSNKTNRTYVTKDNK